jgi:hypothetical protein
MKILYNDYITMQYNTESNIEDINNDFELSGNIIHNLSNDNLYLKKKKLIEISKNLSKLEYLEIFNIIQEDKCQYSENKNGYFINLLNVSEDTINKITNFIIYIKNKKEELILYDEIINNTKKNISENNDIILNDFHKTEILNNNINNGEYNDIEDEEDVVDNYDNYLDFSSDEDNDLENKLSLKKKKVKYSGKKAKMIKSIRDSNDINKLKNRDVKK